MVLSKRGRIGKERKRRVKVTQNAYQYESDPEEK